MLREWFKQKALLLSVRANSTAPTSAEATYRPVSYDEWVKDFISSRVLLTLRIWLTTNSLYLLTAPIAHPEQTQILFLLHGAIYIGLLTGLALHKSQNSILYPNLLILSAILPVSIGDAHGTAFLNETAYCMYMTLTLLAAAILIPVRWRTHVVAQVATLVYFLGVQVASGWAVASWNTLYDQVMILVSVSGVASYAVYSYECLQRLEFNRRRELELANLELHQLNQEWRSLAALDGLTQIANRRSFDEYLQQEWLRLARENLPLSLILCDIDCFKLYNDTYGHQAGDEYLQRVAQAIKTAVNRPADLIARYGGEKFGVILPTTATNGAKTVAENIRMAVKALEIVHVNSPSKLLSLGLGVASVNPNLEVSPDALMAAADRALYQAKTQGRDRLVWQDDIRPAALNFSVV